MAKTRFWRVLLAGVLVLALCGVLLTACKSKGDTSDVSSDPSSTVTDPQIDPNAPVDVTFRVTLDKPLEDGVILYLAGAFHLDESGETWAEDLRMVKDEADAAGLTYTLVQPIVPGAYAYNFALGTQEGMDWNAKCDQGQDADLQMEVNADNRIVTNALTFSTQPGEGSDAEGFEMQVEITLTNALPDGYTLWLGGNFQETKDNWPILEMTPDSSRKVFTVAVPDAHKTASVPYTVYWSANAEVNWNNKLYEGTFNTTKGPDGTYTKRVSYTPPAAGTVFSMDISITLDNPLPSGRTLWINGNFADDDQNWASYLCTRVSDTRYTVNIPDAHKMKALSCDLYSSTTEFMEGINWDKKLGSATFDTSGGAGAYAISGKIDPNLFDMKVEITLTEALPDGYSLWINGNFYNSEEWGTYPLQAGADRRTFTATVPDTVKMAGMRYDIYWSGNEEVDYNHKLTANQTFDTTGGASGAYRATVSYKTPAPGSTFDFTVTVNLGKPLAAGQSLWINADLFGTADWSSYRLEKVTDTQYTLTIPAVNKSAALGYGIYYSTTEWKEQIVWEPPLAKNVFDASSGAAGTYTVTIP